MILVSIYTCCRCCWDCCCRHEDHDHHDEKGSCCGLCGGAALRHADKPPPKIVPPERKQFWGMDVDWARLARGKRAHFAGEKWGFWGRIGPEGHGSWFNRWVPRWLGGRNRVEDWDDAAREAEKPGGEGFSSEKPTRTT